MCGVPRGTAFSGWDRQRLKTLQSVPPPPLQPPVFFMLWVYLLPRRVVRSLLSQAGDIESNPGPHTIWTCTHCTQTIKNNQTSIQCNTCTQWQHIKCTTIKSTKNYTTQYKCNNCTTPNINNTASHNIITQQHHNTNQSQINTTPNNNTTQSHSIAQSTQQQTQAPTNQQQNTNHAKNKKQINILQININGINTSIQELIQLTIAPTTSPDIICIQETKLTNKHKTPKIPTYTAIRKDRPNKGGVY